MKLTIKFSQDYWLKKTVKLEIMFLALACSDLGRNILKFFYFSSSNLSQLKCVGM